MHTTGVRVSIRRTITPAKYTALMAYKATGVREAKGERERDEEVTGDQDVMIQA